MMTGRFWSTGIICDAGGSGAQVANPLKNGGGAWAWVFRERRASIKNSSTEIVGMANPSICKLVS